MAPGPKRPRDMNQMAKQLIDIVSGEVEDTLSAAKRSPHKRRAGGLKGGPARARRSVALHFMHYNFARVHMSLRVAPAMAAGLSDRVWSIEEIVGCWTRKLISPSRLRSRVPNTYRTSGRKG